MISPRAPANPWAMSGSVTGSLRAAASSTRTPCRANRASPVNW